MDFNFLRFLENPLFVLSWFSFGIAAAAWVIYDLKRNNTYVEPGLKPA